MNKTAFIFDIDGVLTNDQLEVNERLLKCVAELAEMGAKIAFLTGRSSPWLKSNILEPLSSLLTKDEFERNIYAAFEFGAGTFENENGQLKAVLDENVNVPQNLKDEARKIFEEFKSAMWIEEKEAMFTIVARQDIPLSEFHPKQKELEEKLNTLLTQNNMHDKFEIQADLIATNIRAKVTNKRNAAKGFYEWLKKQDFEPEMTYSFGDSPDDYETSSELKNENLNCKFIFVRPRSDFPNHPEDILFTQKHLDQGTLEFLNTLN